MDKIIARFQADEARRTKAGRKLSDYFCRQLKQVPFETSASTRTRLIFALKVGAASDGLASRH